MSIGGHQSARAGSTTWLTPPGVLAALGAFDLDPCTPPEMPWRTAEVRYTEEDDGLAQPWFGRVWLNPPYGRRVGEWMRRMAEHDRGTALIFARTETEAFHRHVWERASALLFMEGRLHFCMPNGERARANAGAPSVLVSYGPEDADVLADCGIDGAFVPLSTLGQTVLVVRHPENPELTWRELLRSIAVREGGGVSLDVAYRVLAGHPKAQRNPNWRAKTRQVLQGPEFRRVGRGEYELSGED